MTLSDLIGLEASRLVPLRRRLLGLAILGLTPVLLVVEWMSSASVML